MRVHRTLSIVPCLLMAAFAAVFGATPAAGVTMNDYCIVPPYVVQNIQPNVMIVVDTSGSMFNMAYSDGFHTAATSDDHACTSSDPCSGFPNPGTYPGFKYYGYFNPDYWYSYSSAGGKFIEAAPKPETGLSTARTKGASEWDGNFLNWLSMRRVDVIRKAMTGGKRAGGEGTGWDKVETEKADCSARGYYMTYSNVAPYTPYAGTRIFTLNYQSSTNCNGGGSGVTSFSVSSTSDTFNVRVVVPTPVSGVLQNVVGSRARIGLTFFKVNDGAANNEGGKVRVNVGGGSLSSTVNELNNTRPFTNTPLGEALWTVTGYYAQQDSLLGGPGPRYSTSDYGISTSADPLNYGQGSTSRWPVCSKSYVLYITDGEPCGDGNLPASLVDYAAGRSNYNCSGGGCPSVAKPLTGGSFASSTFQSCSAGGYTAGFEDVALYMHTNDLRSGIANTQNLTLYAVFAFGKGSTAVRYAAINGGFEDDGTGTPNNQDTWDKNRDGEPDTYYEASDGYELEQAIGNALSSILKRASSGTAASVLASGEGSGANLLQAVFYPRRAIGDDIILWAGALQNLWYFVDPFFTNATIREDTTQDNVLNLVNDDVMQFHFNQTTQLTEVLRWRDTDGDGDTDAVDNTISFENVKSLWEAGKKLWGRNLSSSPRTIKTSLDGSTLIDFSTANASTLSGYLIPDAGDTAATIIGYVTGVDNTDNPNMRSRTVSFGSDNSVWKLGDIIDSTPRIVSGIALNKYDSVYFDTTYGEFINTTAYKNRGMVFAGGNDGMLHAFRLGKLELSWTGRSTVQKARITNPISGTVLGDEAWAFVPKNSLPYLKYLKDPDYCHLYYVDLSPYIFDASIGGNPTDVRAWSDWRTVIIGGMRFGGACANASTCTDPLVQNCVPAPATDNGFSSYFAMDVTNPESPTLLWEFTNPNLGFTTTGPAVVRLNALNTSGPTPFRDRTLNGEWYVVLGSGPTGPIDNTHNQFLGRSNQNLRYFVLNLKTGALVQTIDTGITNAFAGSMINSVADFNLDYQDDTVYTGYVKRAGSSPNYTWTDGGVGRIITKNETPGTVTPWAFSQVIDGIGPVTSAISRLQSRALSLNWLYFGTGRYFFENPPSGTDTTPTIDDPTGQRRLFGIKEPCFTASNQINTTCSSTVLFSSLDNVTSISDVPSETVANSSGFSGWFIDMDPSADYSYDNTAARPFRSERVITDPLATTSGVVFFTTYKPYGDECALGGKSFLWGLRYNTGNAPSAAVMKGKALVQVSTASVEQIDLATAFTQKDGRRTGAIEGVPPTSQGLSLLSQPPPVKRIMHMKER